MIIRSALFAIGLGLVVACSDDATTTNNANSPFNPANSPDGSTPAGNSSGGNPDGGGALGDCTTPAGCFCGTPTTQAQFLNRCTKSAALPVTETVKAATLDNVP